MTPSPRETSQPPPGRELRYALAVTVNGEQRRRGLVGTATRAGEHLAAAVRKALDVDALAPACQLPERADVGTETALHIAANNAPASTTERLDKLIKGAQELSLGRR